MRKLTLIAPVFACWAVISAPLAAKEPCAPEIGVICAGGETISYDALLERVRAADIVLLGERHDNPAHHEWQARIVGDLQPNGLAFEMVPEALEDYANAARINGDDLEEALEWSTSGWPDWEMYAPIFDAAPDAWVAGGGVAPDILRLSVTKGAAEAWPERAGRYRLAERLPQEVSDAMLDEQDVAHCGALPRAMLPGMVEAQQLRDASFADAALRLIDAGRAPAALITGNGHARTDRGAPLYIGRAAPELAVASVGIIELEKNISDAPFDIVIYTEPFDRGDPCEEFIRKRQKTE